MGALHKTQLPAHFHIGNIITSIHNVSTVASGWEVLLSYMVLVPLASKESATVCPPVIHAPYVS
jgi:splicing factor 3B subunit 3